VLFTAVMFTVSLLSPEVMLPPATLVIVKLV
jgi:hypothetical protein